MDKQDAPQQATQEEEARIGETPAIFSNKVCVSPMPGNEKISFAEARQASGEDLESPRVTVFLQHAALPLLELDGRCCLSASAVRCTKLRDGRTPLTPLPLRLIVQPRALSPLGRIPALRGGGLS